MQTKSVLGLTEIDAIMTAARAEAQQHGWAVTIALVDDGGHPLALVRLDGASPASALIATEKARTSALGRRESKAYEDMINGGRPSSARRWGVRSKAACRSRSAAKWSAPSAYPASSRNRTRRSPRPVSKASLFEPVRRVWGGGAPAAPRESARR
jgi:hypothetical protein